MSGLVVVVFLVAFIAWLVLPSLRRRSTETDEPVDREELEAAEREVRDLGIEQRPEDGWRGDDWGPGAAKPPQR
jgi:hypothetical protein